MVRMDELDFEDLLILQGECQARIFRWKYDCGDDSQHVKRLTAYLSVVKAMVEKKRVVPQTPPPCKDPQVDEVIQGLQKKNEELEEQLQELQGKLRALQCGAVHEWIFPDLGSAVLSPEPLPAPSGPPIEDDEEEAAIAREEEEAIRRVKEQFTKAREELTARREQKAAIRAKKDAIAARRARLEAELRAEEEELAALEAEEKPKPEECPVCFQPMIVPTTTACNHQFCGSCLARCTACPMCRADLQ